MRCRRKPPHVINGRIATHKNQKECDAMGTRNVFVEPSSPSPPSGATSTDPEAAPGATSSSPPTSEAPPSTEKPKPPFVRRFIRPMPRADVREPTAPALAVAEEWELSEELAGRFWGGIATLGRYFLGILGTFWEVESSVIHKYQSSMEPNTADLHMLGQATRDGLTSFFKKMGVKSLEAAERIINSLGGFAVLLAIFMPVFAFVLQEIPHSPRWIRMKERRRAKAKGEPVAPGSEPAAPGEPPGPIRALWGGKGEPDAAAPAGAAG